MKREEAEVLRQWVASCGFVGCNVRPVVADTVNAQSGPHVVTCMIDGVNHEWHSREEIETFLRTLWEDVKS